MAIVWTALALAFVALITYWPFVAFKNDPKRQALIGVPVICAIILLILFLTRR